jgi:hypothetical protein
MKEIYSSINQWRKGLKLSCSEVRQHEFCNWETMMDHSQLFVYLGKDSKNSKENLKLRGKMNLIYSARKVH